MEANELAGNCILSEAKLVIRSISLWNSKNRFHGCCCGHIPSIFNNRYSQVILQRMSRYGHQYSYAVETTGVGNHALRNSPRPPSIVTNRQPAPDALERLINVALVNGWT